CGPACHPRHPSAGPDFFCARAVISKDEESSRRRSPGFTATGFVFILLAHLVAAATLLAQPPAEPGKSFRPDDLVEIVNLDTTIRLDIRYATTNNFMHRPMYAEARAFLQRPAAKALVSAGRALRKKGYGLLVFDGYRPWAVTKKFWDETPPEKHNFVADPQKGSKHNRGCAVDLSL